MFTYNSKLEKISNQKIYIFQLILINLILMNPTNEYKLNFLLIILVAFLLFFLKWFLSFYIFPDEDMTIRIINDSFADSHMYFHYIKSLAEFDFNSLYLPESISSNFLPIPYGSVIFHAVLYKLLGIETFIFLEFLSIFIFLLIFTSIFKTIKFSNTFSLLLATILFILPNLISFFNFLDIQELNTFVANFFNLRFPRPFIANLLFFSFIYLLLNSHIERNIFEYKNIFILSIIFSLSFSSFFFLFLNEAITFILYLFFYFKKNIFSILKKNLIKIIYSICLFIILVSPFVFLIFNAGEDYMERMGLISITLEDKVFLLKHYLYKLFRIKLIIIYALLFLNIFLLKKFSPNNYRYIFIFYIMFLSSIISPLLFILISTKIAFLYHFNNTVVMCLILLIIILFIINIRLLFERLNIKFFNKFYLASSILLILLFYNSIMFNEYKIKKNDLSRIDRNYIINFLLENKEIDLHHASVQTHDTKLMTWMIFKNNQNLRLIDGTLTLRNNSQIENDLINSFKILNLSKNDFEKFIENRRVGYRYINHDLRPFFWQRYTANSLYTYRNSQDFEPVTLKFLNNSSPFYSHQFALPTYEIQRLLKKFLENNTQYLLYPKLLIVEKNHHILKKASINGDFYCKKYDGNNFNFFVSKKYC